MPEQFVNPSPSLRIIDFLFFDFPCEDGVPVEPLSSYKVPRQPGPPANIVYGPNINLVPPAVEQIYGQLGSPPREQGHPYMREYPWTDLSGEDPNIPPMIGGVDQVVDIDRGIRVDHTGRLSGGFVGFIASRPFFSEVEVSAVAVAPVAATTASIDLGTVSEWLTPQAPAPNVWFWRRTNGIMNGPIASNELLFTRDVVIPAGGLGAAGFVAECVYKLVYQWRFWRFIGPVPPADPPSDPGSNPDCVRMPISGFDESIAFEVISQTAALN